MEQTTQPTITEAQPAAIPESITIGGQVYIVKDTPELQRLVIAVSNRERGKFYSTSADLKKRLDALQSVEIIEPAPVQSGITAEEIASIVSKVVDEKLKPLTQSEATRQAEDLATYKARILRDNIGKCIPEYVSGQTREELDQSMAKSIEVRANFPSPNATHVNTTIVDPLIVSQMAAANEGPEIQLSAEHVQQRLNADHKAGAAATPTPTPASTAPQVAPTSSPNSDKGLPQLSVSDLRGMPDVSKMTADQYAKERDSLMNQFAETFQNPS